MTSFKLVKYTPRIKKKKKGLRKLARKVPTDRLLKFERVFKAQKRIHMSVFKAQRVLDEIRWCRCFIDRLENLYECRAAPGRQW